EVTALLGKGGMGEVYRAHDTKLGRDVALKVLAREVVDQPEYRERLLSEARAAASLNHPNICTIHEIGEAEGEAYIAMELVEGQTLSMRLADGPVPVQDVHRYGLQLADALSHAHNRAIVHRDVKSSNVVITHEGRIKLLDFGLAKRFSGEELSDATTRAETTFTQSGTILGTLAYMAPEQLRAQPADARSDIWAVGIVLYEMAVGIRPFDGKTAYELSSAIFHASPPPLPTRVPAQLQVVVSHCLQKEPARRYQRASELQAALEAVAGPAQTRVAQGPFRLAGMSALVLLVLIGVAVWLNLARIRDRFTSSGEQIRSIAVLPPENLSGDPA